VKPLVSPLMPVMSCQVRLSSQSWFQPSMPPPTPSIDFCLLLFPGVIHVVCQLWCRILRFLLYVNLHPHSPSSASLAFSWSPATWFPSEYLLHSFMTWQMQSPFNKPVALAVLWEVFWPKAKGVNPDRKSCRLDGIGRSSAACWNRPSSNAGRDLSSASVVSDNQSPLTLMLVIGGGARMQIGHWRSSFKTGTPTISFAYQFLSQKL